MKIRKSALLFLVLPLIVLSACRTAPIDLRTEPGGFITETTPPITTAAAMTAAPVSTVLHSRLYVLQETEIRVFFNEYKEMMQELARSFSQLNMKGASIANGYFASYTDETDNEVPFDEELQQKIIAYLTIAETETKRATDIHVGYDNGKQKIAFGFGSLDLDAYIIYMPDGYIKPSYPNPQRNESEIMLAENWYAYYDEYLGD